MKVLFFTIFILGLSFSGCSSKHQAQKTQDNSFYDRANSASEKSLQGLERDTK